MIDTYNPCKRIYLPLVLFKHLELLNLFDAYIQPPLFLASLPFSVYN